MNKELLQSFIDKNYSTYKIAKEIGKSQCSVRYWLKKFSLKTNYLSTKDCKWINRPTPLDMVCRRCKTLRPIIDFYKNKNETGYYTYCKKCASFDTVDRLRKYKIECIGYKGGKCQKCGYDKCYAALDFHHLDPAKKNFAIGSSNKSFESVKSELDKCILLCANCHREHHAEWK